MWRDLPELNQGPLPVSLIIANEGGVVRRIRDRQFLWAWRFEHNGTQVAYETGPLHFSLSCVLVDVATAGCGDAMTASPTPYPETPPDG